MSSELEKFVDEFPWIENKTTPWSDFKLSLSQSRIALISTGGLYIEGDKPFKISDRKDVDESYREIPLASSTDNLAIAHEHYEKRYARQDINTVFPVERLKKLVEENFLGDLARINFSITGFIPEPDGLFRSGKEIAQKLASMKVDAAFIVPV